MRNLTMCIGVFLLGMACGCGKTLDQDASFDVPMEGKFLTVEPITTEQNVKVTGTATGAPVNVYLYLEKNRQAAEKDILAKKLVSPVIPAKVEKAETFTLTATIPANETAVVQVTRAGMAAKVQLRISNK